MAGVVSDGSDPDTDADGATEEAPRWDVPKRRACLRCGNEFQSQWSGERICAYCKRSTTWRRGVPARTTPPGS